MTREEAIAEINKVFEHAFANYIITALTEGVTPSERKTGKWIKDIYGNVVCSECRANRRDNRVGHIAFCNSCGAKMEVYE